MDRLAVQKIMANLIGKHFIPSRMAGTRLNQLAKYCDGDEERLVKLVYRFEFKYPFLASITVRPTQIFDEILALTRIIFDMRPRTILEIGTGGGGTLFLWCQAGAQNATIVSLDLPGNPKGSSSPDWKIPLYRSLAGQRQELHLVRADSHNQETLAHVRQILRGRQVDFLFIDGDHSLNGVKKDFEMYGSLARKGGVIALHDIVEHPLETRCEVSEFWKSIKGSMATSEIVKDRHQNGCGIGLVFV
jgi:predicted O-methyltransferase YrrM